jgi:hypothetical protein
LRRGRLSWHFTRRLDELYHIASTSFQAPEEEFLFLSAGPAIFLDGGFTFLDAYHLELLMQTIRYAYTLKMLKRKEFLENF